MPGKDSMHMSGFDNPSYSPSGPAHPPPPYHDESHSMHATGFKHPSAPAHHHSAYYGEAHHSQGPVILAPPTNDSIGLFLDADPVMVVQPRGALPTGPTQSLDYLRNVSSLIVKQKIELVEILTSFDTANRFTIYDQSGQIVFYALEDSDCCVRQCCGPARPFEMKIYDIYQNEVIHIYRPLACQGCCCFCCLMVSSPPGTVVGKVQQTWSLIYPNFDVRNAVGETVLKIKGPCWRCSCGGDIVFKIYNLNGEEVGDISKTWGGLAREYFTDADNFRINFPENLTVDVKAALCGAIFLIDVMYFERKK